MLSTHDGMRGTVIAAAILSSTVAQAQPAESLTIDVADLATFTVGPQHAKLRWFTLDGCGTVADLKPLRALPPGVEIQLGKSNCLTIDKVDGLEDATVVMSFAIHNDLSALTNAKKLRRLYLGNGVLPLGVLGAMKLPALESLDLNLRKNTKADVTWFLASPLVAQVKDLSIGVDHAPVLPPLPELTGLSVSLMLQDSSRVDLSFVRSTPALKRLRVGGAIEADLTPLLTLKKLETLDVAGLCRIDPRPLARLPKLRWMTISMLVEETHKPVRSGLDVTRSNPYVLCSPPKP